MTHGLVSRKAAEIAFAMILAGFGAVIIIGAREMDTGWGGSGPEAGYFPFRIGALLVVVALAILLQEALKGDQGERLMPAQPARNILRFCLPLIGLVVLIPFAGIYLAAAIYLAVAVGVLGRIAWTRALSIAILTPAIMFILFEFVFRTPLPKGPLGPLLGMI
jgi:drug/metabolite transporter (DMT)-like permease